MGTTDSLTGLDGALPDSRERNRMLFEAAPYGILFENPDGAILSANPAAVRILGLSSEQMQAGEPLEIPCNTLREDGLPFRPEDLPGRLALRTGKPVEDVVVGIQHPEGVTWVQVSAVPLVRPGEDHPFQACVTFMDVSERKRLEEAQVFLAKADWLRTGEGFFPALARFLAQHMSMDYVCIDRLVGDGLAAETLAVWFDGRLEDEVTYTLTDTPCGAVAGKHICCFPRGVRQLFPRDQVLQDMAAESYLGATLWSSAGRPIGLMALISRRPMAEAHKLQPALALAAQRAAAELERRETEAAHRASEARYRTLFDHAGDAIFIHDEHARVLAANPMACERLGYSAEEFISMAVGEVDSPEEASHGAERMEQLSRNGQLTFRTAHRRRDGTSIPTEVSARRISWDGRPAVMAICRDITERERAEEALQQSERKFRTLFENMAEGVALHEIVHDATGRAVDFRLLDVNPAYERHTGLDASTAPGRLGTEVYGTAEPPYLAEFGAVAQHGQPYAFETYFPPLDKHFRISVISPGPDQFATVFEDITDRKRREEELKQKNAEMERFTYMVSHDLKSPLVTVRTFLGYLEQDLEQGRMEHARKDMGYIRDATGKMGRLLEDLLEVSRVGRVVNPPVHLTFADLAQEALRAVAGPISSRGVALQVDDRLVRLFGDRLRLEEIWQNLVENAVKYMGDQPAPFIELGVEGSGPDTVFFVRDNGMGIDPRYQERVFGLFEKLDPSTEGTGLGLALVKRIVELNEGRVWVESEPGRGACFRFTLPLAMKDRKEAARS